MDAQKSEAKVFLKCALPQCKDLRFNLFHRFPRNPERCKAWLEAFDNPALYAMPHLRLVQKTVCSRHFRVTDYIYPESRKLNIGRVPSLNLKSLDQLDICRHGITTKMEYETKPWPRRRDTNDLAENESVDDISNNENTNDAFEVSDKSIGQLNNVSLASKDVLNDNIVSSSEDINDVSLVSTCVEGSNGEDVNDVPLVSTCVEDSNGFQLVVTDGVMLIKDSLLDSPVNADILWLRHMCRCNECFDSIKNKPLINFLNIDNDLQPVMATVLEETKKLDIIWSDGHTSTYNMNQLYEQLQRKQKPNPTPNYLLWNFQHTQYRDDLQPLNWFDLIQSNKTATFKALDRLQKSGLLIINHVPKFDKDSLLKKSIITNIFNHSCNDLISEKRQDFPKHYNTTPFTNCTFHSMDKGLQILTVPYNKDDLKLQLNLVDGFQAIDQLPKATQEFLTQNHMHYSFNDDKGYEYKIKLPVILKADNMERIWFSPHHLASINSQEFRQVSKHFKLLNDVLTMPQNQWQVELNAETIIILNNYRICWCLRDPPKDCELECMYLEKKHYLSSMNILKNTMERL
ncbi:trimethyllysine dioxygenase, mitochondrial-like [Calliphora vicina]|uniref:trimethyllysine dioxygenase, mitochondrial-like n=1 Tax=Calliphora vicina TaxID=7373 RepID=UPI00325AA885